MEKKLKLSRISWVHITKYLLFCCFIFYVSTFCFLKNFNVGPINNKCCHVVKREIFFCKCEFEPFFIIWVLDSEETNFFGCNRTSWKRYYNWSFRQGRNKKCLDVNVTNLVDVNVIIIWIILDSKETTVYSVFVGTKFKTDLNVWFCMLILKCSIICANRIYIL